MTTPTIRQVQRATAAAFGVPVEAMTGRGKTRNLIPARQAAMFLSRKLTGKRLADVARAFYRDHTTINHAVARVLEIHRHDPDFNRRLAEVIANLSAVSENKTTAES